MAKSDYFFADIYNKAGKNPESWTIHSIGLKQCSDVLFAYCQSSLDKFSKGEQLTLEEGNRILSIPSVAMMLFGLAIEAIAKAIIIKSKSSPMLSHNIRDDDKIKRHLTIEEYKLAGKLQTYVEWAGRYPAPKDSIKELYVNGKIKQDRVPTYPHNRTPLINLYEKLHIVYQNYDPDLELN